MMDTRMKWKCHWYRTNFNTWIIVSARGSKGSYNADVAPGGDLQGLYKIYIDPKVWLNMKCKEYPVCPSCRTT